MEMDCLVKFFVCLKSNLALLVSLGFGILGLIFLVFGVFDSSTIKDFFTASGSSFAASALMYAAWSCQNDSREKASKKYLETYIEIFGIILNRLQSQLSSRRTSWNTASSLTDKILKIENKITNKSDMKVLEIYQRNLAHDVNEFLRSKSQLYFCGIDESSGYKTAREFFNAQAQKDSVVVCNSGLIPKFNVLTYIDFRVIKSILDLTNSTWEKEVGYKYKNDDEFMNVVKMNYSELHIYLDALMTYCGRKR